MDLGEAVGLLVIAFFLFGIPIVFVVTDPIIGNKEKAVWVFAIGLASWFGWLLYQYVSPVLPRRKTYDRDTNEQIPPTF